MQTTNNAPTDNADWAAVISTIQDSLPSNFRVYHTPRTCDFHRSIDHTLLEPFATDEQIDKLASEAYVHRFCAVCVRGRNVARAARNLESYPDVAVASVIAFPDGTQTTAEKVKEARDAVDQGATEIDMVINWPLLKKAQYTAVYADILEVRKVTPASAKLKTILETPQLTGDEILAGSVIASMAGADFLQTSTGLKQPGATTETIGLMRTTADIVGRGTKVKASGKICTAQDFIEMMKAGADRVESEAVDILTELGGSEEVQEQGASHSMY